MKRQVKLATKIAKECMQTCLQTVDVHAVAKSSCKTCLGPNQSKTQSRLGLDEMVQIGRLTNTPVGSHGDMN